MSAITEVAVLAQEQLQFEAAEFSTPVDIFECDGEWEVFSAGVRVNVEKVGADRSSEEEKGEEV